jgi:AraC-like DNA-binding protein
MFAKFIKDFCLTFLCSFCSFSFVNSQNLENLNDSDYLKNTSYDELYQLMARVYEDTLLTKKYLNIYYAKAKKEQNKTEQGRVLAWLSLYTQDDTLKLQQLDSAISLTRNTKYNNVRILPFSYRGYYYLTKCNYNKALEDYLMALKLSKEENNEGFTYITKHNIGVIKGEIGKTDQALELFKESLAYERRKGYTNSHEYVTSLLYMAEYSIKKGELDSAKVYLDEGITKAHNIYSQLYCQLLLQKGVWYFKKGEMQLAKKTLTHCLKSIDSNYPQHRRTLILTLYYLALVEDSFSNTKASLAKFIAMDSIIQAKNYRTYEVRHGYVYIINYYKNSGNLKGELNFVNKLLKFDSINNANGILVNEKLYTNFDTLYLLENKDNLISALKKRTINYGYLSVFLGSGLVIVLIVLYFFKLKVRKDKKKLHVVLNTSKESNCIETFSTHIKSSRDIGISEDIIDDLIDQLSSFEGSKGFLDNKISLKSLATEFNSNTSYLSTVINKIKGKSFSNYIKDLRISHAVQELKKNKKLRTQYTVEALSREFGFSNTESFSSAFKNKTGVRPSFFIKQLNKLK